MTIDLSALNATELRKLIADATRERKRKMKRAPIAQARNKLIRQAKADGYTIQELFGEGAVVPRTSTPRKAATKRKTTTGRKIPPKYWNPDDPTQTWTGRGRSPLWFVALIEAGKTREDLLIPE